MTCAQGLLRLLWGARSWSATGLVVANRNLIFYYQLMLVASCLFISKTLVCVLDQPGNNKQLVLSANASLNFIIYFYFAFAFIFICMDCI